MAADWLTAPAQRDHRSNRDLVDALPAANVDIHEA